ncbi:MAG TPA: hypothetical protein VKY22_26505 [Bradyrhizobium sp.]|nr:hypothetical protein [Bradyrhizobium sp.]
MPGLSEAPAVLTFRPAQADGGARNAKREARMKWIDLDGYIAASLVFMTFYMKEYGSAAGGGSLQ